MPVAIQFKKTTPTFSNYVWKVSPDHLKNNKFILGNCLSAIINTGSLLTISILTYTMYYTSLGRHLKFYFHIYKTQIIQNDKHYTLNINKISTLFLDFTFT